MRIATILGCAVALATMGCNGDSSAGTTMAECPADAGHTPTDDGGTGDVDAGPMLDGGGYIVRTAFFNGTPTRGTGADTMVMAGTDFQLNCDVGKVVSGFEAFSTSEQIWGFQLRCAELRTVKFDEGSFEVRTGGASAGMLVGTEGTASSMDRSDCGPNAFGRGLAATSAEGDRVYGLGLLCGEGRVSQDDVEVIGTSNSALIGAGAGGARMSQELECPENAVLTGISGRADPDALMGGILRVSAFCASVGVID